MCMGSVLISTLQNGRMAGSEDSDGWLAMCCFIWVYTVCPAPDYCIEALYSEHCETGKWLSV